METKLSFKSIVIIGFMLFALFFGAGNLIFPAMLGQSAGLNLWSANFGFLITGVGLPLLGVLAFGFSGKEDLLSLASRVHPVFGVVFTSVLYLTIGPLFAIPRTGSVSFEIGIKPFLPEGAGFVPLLVFTIVYFGVTCLFSLNPSKIVDIVGKILTPLLLLFVGILAVVGVVNPIGKLQPPTEKYTAHAFFHGFQEGYLTMDALAAFVFGIIVINTIQAKGATAKKQMMSVCLKAAVIASSILAIIYSVLSYIGATSVEQFGHLDNGGAVLSQVSHFYFGMFGSILMGLIVILACLTTSVGLITACAAYFHKLIPSVSYKTFAIGLSVFSTIIANAGLAQLISFSVPVLTIIYPVAIVLMFLTFFHSWFKGKASVYQGSLLLTFLISLIDGLKETGLNVAFLDDFLRQYLPLYNIGLGWIIPALIGCAIGLAIKMPVKGQNNQDYYPAETLK
ncbi:branched-chain amino acid transport system II carrier protein [Brevibacillus fulvus]|uniref:Branched-chain amino acid transport system carrier protein n=1 Tax=Brevibacillus fulvus TaxID=1125967 RepID=A0A938Y2E1_9BACL|nr:branched-chain amino acid transport system II carrier protein [Brevibacillus fulvus]MBM7591134.1 LIVCS family branched-chain amino acid:cation transporter [Brevibacillus fulvus]